MDKPLRAHSYQRAAGAMASQGYVNWPCLFCCAWLLSESARPRTQYIVQASPPPTGSIVYVNTEASAGDDLPFIACSPMERDGGGRRV